VIFKLTGTDAPPAVVPENGLLANALSFRALKQGSFRYCFSLKYPAEYIKIL